MTVTSRDRCYYPAAWNGTVLSARMYLSPTPETAPDMVSWRVYNFECEDEAARETLMTWFEANHPVAFPDDRYSVFEQVDAGDRTTGADYAWLDRYLYVTVMGEAGSLVQETAGLWERATVAVFDGTTDTAQQVTFVLEVGDEGEAKGVRFEGVEGGAGNDVLYALAMEYGFRFRAYSGQSPTTQGTPHPGAFDAVEDVPAFVEEQAAATGVEPTESGRELLADDPAADDRYVWGETYGPVDREGDEAGGLLARVRTLFGG